MDKLYYIAERDNLEDIRKRGIAPGTSLCEAKDIAPWLAVMERLDNPAVLEVDAGNLKGLEPGPVFMDRKYVPQGYREYFTPERIPASAVQEADLGHGFTEIGTRVRSGVLEQLERSTTERDIEENRTGMNRLVQMNLFKQEQADAIVRQHENILKEVGPDKIGEYYEEAIEDDAFSKAVADLGDLHQQKDFGSMAN